MGRRAVSGATVAAFDVDGTITRRDCVVPFMYRTRGWPRLSAGLLRRGPALAAATLRRDRDRLKSIGAAAAFSGMPIDDLRVAGAEFVDEVVVGWLRNDTVERLRWHREQGHLVVLVSASFEVYLDHLGAHLGVAAALGTRLEVSEGRCTGRLDGPNCRGDEKVRRLHGWMHQAAADRGTTELWAYGDSAGDAALLADADHPVWAASPLTSVAP